VVEDPAGVEGRAGSSAVGLGLLDVRTVFAPEKVLCLASGTALGAPVSGYEIHHGVVDGTEEPFPGGARRGAVFGTMWHGSLESDEFRDAFLAAVAASAGRTRDGSGVRFAAAREARLDLLADLVEQHADVDALLALVDGRARTDLPVLPPGADLRVGP
jgi:adenosylcobyric acid synthase